MKNRNWKTILCTLSAFMLSCVVWINCPMLSHAEEGTNNFNVWNHLGQQPYVYSFYTVGGQGLYILLRKIIVYGCTLCVFFGLIALLIIKNPRVILQRKQDIVDKLTLIVLASGSITFLNLLFNLCNAIFYK